MFKAMRHKPFLASSRCCLFFLAMMVRIVGNTFGLVERPLTSWESGGTGQRKVGKERASMQACPIGGQEKALLGWSPWEGMVAMYSINNIYPVDSGAQDRRYLVLFHFWCSRGGGFFWNLALGTRMEHIEAIPAAKMVLLLQWMHVDMLVRV
jgi:hypothetical protein